LRRNNDRALLWADGYCNHVPLNVVPQPDTNVIALFHDIHKAIFDIQFDFDVRELRQQATQHGPDDRLGHVVCGRNSDSARRLVAVRTQCTECGPDVLK